MRRLHVALASIALLGCGPMGNTLGLEGIYEGSTTTSGSGTVTTFSGTSSTVFDSEYDKTADSQLIIEPGYTTDAVLPSDSCPIALRVESDKLVLAESVTCSAVTETKWTGSGVTATTKETTQTTFTEVEISKDGDNQIKATMKVNSSAQKESDGEKEQEVTLSLTLDFSGTRVANY
jgi:hypothetical protein